MVDQAQTTDQHIRQKQRQALPTKQTWHILNMRTIFAFWDSGGGQRSDVAFVSITRGSQFKQRRCFSSSSPSGRHCLLPLSSGFTNKEVACVKWKGHKNLVFPRQSCCCRRSPDVEPIRRRFFISRMNISLLLYFTSNLEENKSWITSKKYISSLTSKNIKREARSWLKPFFF